MQLNNILLVSIRFGRKVSYTCTDLLCVASSEDLRDCAIEV